MAKLLVEPYSHAFHQCSILTAHLVDDRLTIILVGVCSAAPEHDGIVFECVPEALAHVVRARRGHSAGQHVVAELQAICVAGDRPVGAREGRKEGRADNTLKSVVPENSARGDGVVPHPGDTHAAADVVEAEVIEAGDEDVVDTVPCGVLHC